MLLLFESTDICSRMTVNSQIQSAALEVGLFHILDCQNENYNQAVEFRIYWTLKKVKLKKHPFQGKSSFLPIYFLFWGPYDIFSFHKKFFHLLLREHSIIFPTECPHLSAKN